MECPNCGLPGPASQRFCPRCGTAFQSRCQKCGAAVEASDRFCGSCGAKLMEAAPQSTSSPAPWPAQTSADSSHLERRFLSVLFCDLVDYTGLSERFDPEELRDLIASFRSSSA